MALRVHHLNCATLRPPFAKLVNGSGGIFARGRLVCHCLLIENKDGLVLVDTGFGLGDIADPKRLGAMNLLITKPRFDAKEAAVNQVARLGFARQDVRHIVMTHLDVDHAGGLGDFPEARVHVLDKEHNAAMHPQTNQEKGRYIQKHWVHGPRWTVHRACGDSWFCFENAIEILPEVLLVPLIGHTRGHCGVAVKLNYGWLLHCGDVYTHLALVDQSRRCPPGPGWHLKSTAVDLDLATRSLEKVRNLFLRHSNEVSICSAHDADEFSRCEQEG